VPDVAEIAAGALEGGADGLTLVNTLLGLALDVESGQPVLGAGGGGLSGAAVHPVAVRAVWECRAAFPEVPIVGVGGVMSGRDAVELLLAGADAVQVGTATFRDPRAPWKVLRQLARWCDTHATSVGQIRDDARRRAKGADAGSGRDAGPAGAADSSARPTAAPVPLLNEGGRDG
jgi:dihydroorotate dehydrogenase (NAD+) catalytic subunit